MTKNSFKLNRDAMIEAVIVELGISLEDNSDDLKEHIIDQSLALMKILLICKRTGKNLSIKCINHDGSIEVVAVPNGR